MSEVERPARTHVVTDWKGYENYTCPSCPFATLDARVFDRHSCRGEVRLAPDPLESVAFTDDTKALAAAAGLAASDFAGREPSDHAGYTPSDVRQIVADSHED